MHGGLYPSVIARGVKPEAPFKVRIEAGVSSDAEELVEIRTFAAHGKKAKLAPRFEKGTTPVFELDLHNLGAGEAEVRVAFTLTHAFINGTAGREVVLEPVRIPGSDTRRLLLDIPVEDPGCHWIDLELRSGERVLQRARRAFVYDADGYRPELTRPDDFEAFWAGHLEAMRRIPMEPVLKEVPERSSDAAIHYRVEFTAPDGKRKTFDLQAPRGEGPYEAMFQNGVPKTADSPRVVRLGFPHEEWPEQATYNHWENEADNNLFHCYLLAVRLTDYLRSRPDVTRIHLSGASRQGPIQLVNAALDPEKIASVTAHVPTSMGVSQPYPYRGWGKAPSPRSMAAYVDPLNFAPDITVPFIIDVGMMDGLSPAPGALAFYNHADQVEWKRLALEEGGHGYFTSGFRKEASAELDAYLDAKLDTSVQDDAILREH